MCRVPACDCCYGGARQQVCKHRIYLLLKLGFSETDKTLYTDMEIQSIISRLDKNIVEIDGCEILTVEEATESELN